MDENKKTVKVVLENETYEILIPENEKLYLELKNDGQQVVLDKKTYNNIYTNGFNRISFDRERDLPEYDLDIEEHHSSIIETINEKANEFVLNNDGNTVLGDNNKNNQEVEVSFNDDLNDMSDSDVEVNKSSDDQDVGTEESTNDDDSSEEMINNNQSNLDISNIFNTKENDDDDDEDDLTF